MRVVAGREGPGFTEQREAPHWPVLWVICESELTVAVAMRHHEAWHPTDMGCSSVGKSQGCRDL